MRVPLGPPKILGAVAQEEGARLARGRCRTTPAGSTPLGSRLTGRPPDFDSGSSGSNPQAPTPADVVEKARRRPAMAEIAGAKPAVRTKHYGGV